MDTYLKEFLPRLPYHAYGVDPDGRILFSNARTRPLNLSPREMEGRALEEVFPPHVAQAIREQITACLQTGEPGRVMWEVAEGDSRWMREDVLIPMHGPEGPFVLILAHPVPRECLDVFEREARERTLLSLAATYSYVLCLQNGETAGVWFSDAFREDFGVDDPGKHSGYSAVVHPEDRKILEAHLARIRNGESSVAEFRVIRKDGSIRWIRDHALPLPSDHTMEVFGASLDITDLRTREEDHQRTTGLYDFLARVNQAIVRTPEPHEFLPGVCEIAVQSGGFRLAWIALADQQGTLRIVAHAGIDETFLNHLRDLVERPDPVCNLTAEAFQKGAVVISLNVLEDPRTRAWRTFAQKLGIRSTASVPIRSGERVVGVLNLCASKTTHFQDPEELRVLEALADDIGFALDRHEQAELRRRAEEDLKEREAMFRTLAETTSTAIFVYQGERFVYVNRATEEISGYSREELLSMRFWDVVHPDFRELIRERGVARQRGEPVPTRYEFKILRKDGEERWIDFTAGKIMYHGKPAAIGTAVDITERKLAEEVLRERESRLREIADHLDEIVFLALPDFSRVLYVNPAFFRIFGLPEQPVEDFSLWVHAIHPDDRSRAVPGEGDGIPDHPVEYRIIRPDGDVRWLRVRIRPVEEHGTTVRLVGVAADITDVVRAKEEIQRLAFFDPLTGLPNRALFLDRLRQTVAHAAEEGRGVVLLHADLVRFREVNETLGHAAGDRILQEIRGRLRGILPEDATLARIGPDDFGIILYRSLPGQAENVAQKIREAIRGTYTIGDRNIQMDARVGLAVYPDDGDSVEELVAHAEIALHRAREEGQSVAFYRKEMSERLRRRKSVAEILNALLRREDGISVHFQPVVSLETGRVAGAEALLRVGESPIGPLSSLEVVSVAREEGVLPFLTLAVIRNVARWIKRFHDQGYLLPGPISVNITSEDVENPEFTERLEQVIRDEGVDPAWIALEITESGAMTHPDVAENVFRDLKTRGFELFLDDFGTGYSALAYLKSFPLDRLKIDHTFVRDMEEDPNDHAIVSATVAMALALGLETVAEGVETKRQAQMLRTLGCDYAQGFYFGKPVPPEEFADRWLSKPGLSDD